MGLIDFSDVETNIPNPSNDGKTHINIYSKGKTKLGRMLSNFYPCIFTFEPYGTFGSGEAFWYWYLTGQKHHDLKMLSGFNAKKKGRLYLSDKIQFDDKAEDVMCHMIICKIMQNEEIKNSLMKSTLPFIHYYNYDGNIKIVECEWMINIITELRDYLKNME